MTTKPRKLNAFAGVAGYCAVAIIQIAPAESHVHDLSLGVFSTALPMAIVLATDFFGAYSGTGRLHNALLLCAMVLPAVATGALLFEHSTGNGVAFVIAVFATLATFNLGKVKK